MTTQVSVLVIDDDRTVRDTLSDFLETLGFSSRCAASAADGRRLAREHATDVALVDIRLPDANSLTLLDELLTDDPEMGVILITGHGDIPAAIQGLQRGAADYLVKPINLDTLDIAMRRTTELVRLRREVAYHRSCRDEIRFAPGVERLIDLAAQNADVPVLILGEAGTRKSAVARCIHDRSDRGTLPFLRMRCAPEGTTSIEDALFGHERGALAGTGSATRGLLELAGSGTVLLADIGEATPELQDQLASVTAHSAFRRLGSDVELHTSARLIASTDLALGEMVAAGHFRSDLFYRLQVLTVALPPLRERTAELASIAGELLPEDSVLSPGALRAMERYTWPGNDRELRNTLWRAQLLADGAAIEVRHLGLPRNVSGETDAPKSLAEVERKAIADALRATDGNKVRAAALLGIARSTLQEKLKLAPDA